LQNGFGASRPSFAATPGNGDAPCFVFGQQLRSSASPRIILEIKIAERLTVRVAHDEAGAIASSMVHGGGKRRGIGVTASCAADALPLHRTLGSRKKGVLNVFPALAKGRGFPLPEGDVPP
jgi:hypothetical protein